MAEETKTESKAESKSESKAPKAAKLAPAGESSDPEVHQLLGQRQAAASNLADATADEAAKAAAKAAQEQIDQVDKQLAELGVTAQ